MADPPRSFLDIISGGIIPTRTNDTSSGGGYYNDSADVSSDSQYNPSEPGAGFGPPSSVGVIPPTTEVDPRSGFPSLRDIKTKGDAEYWAQQASILLDELEEQIRKLDTGGGKNTKGKFTIGNPPELTFSATSPSNFAYDGEDIDDAEYARLKSNWEASPSDSPELASLRAQYDSVSSYYKTVNSTAFQDPLPKGDTTTGSGSSSGGSGGGSGGAAPKAPKPVEITVDQFMQVIAGKESGGNYDAHNTDAGSHYGAFQISDSNWPSWAQEAGLSPNAPKTPENQNRVARNKMQQYFNQFGSWDLVARAWYAGPGSINYSEEALNRPQGGGKYPSINEYVADVMGRLNNLVPGASGGGGVTGSFSDPLLDYLKSGEYLLENERQKETRGQYDDHAQRMKDYISISQGMNNLIGDKAAMQKLNQQIQEGAMATSMNVNAAIDAGKTGDYWDRLAGPIWSNSLGGLEQQLQQAPEGFADSLLRVIPREVIADYIKNATLGLPEPDRTAPDYYWTPDTIPRYASGTDLPYDIRDAPYVAIWEAGGNIPGDIKRRLLYVGAIQERNADGSTPIAPGSENFNKPDPATGATQPDPWAPRTGDYPGQGWVPIGQTLPGPISPYDTNDWITQAVNQILMNISANRAANPWGEDFTSWIGVPVANMPESFKNRIRQIVIAHKDDPAFQQTFGKNPGIQTTWVVDVNNPPPGYLESQSAGTKDPKAPNPVTAGGSYGGAYGPVPSTSTYTGSYSGSLSAADSARIALEKESLALQKQALEWQKELQKAQLVISQNADQRNDEYTAAQIRWGDVDQELKKIQLELSQKSQQLQEMIFQEQLRAAQVNEAMSGEKLNLDKVRQAADIEYQQAKLELERQAGALSQAEYEERKRQFDVTFNYQKDKDQKELDLQRAKITTDYMSNPNDPIARQFWYANQKAPVGTAYDIFTGEDTGRKSYDQIYEEDAQLYKDVMLKPKLMNQGSGNGFVKDLMLILGDDPHSNNASGFDELVYNPTGAPLAVLSNKEARELGVIPPMGFPFDERIVTKGGR